MDALKILIDTAQTRIKNDRVSTLVTGDDWSQWAYQNIYVEPVTKSVMLVPYCYTTDWTNNGTGNYARYKTSDYNLTAANWVDDPVTSVDNYVKGIEPSGNNSEVVTTKVSQPANGSMYLSWYAANAGSDDMVAIECGWGAPLTAPISFRFFSSGRVQIYRNAVFDAEYTINGNQNDSNAQQTANQFVTVTIHPFRRREILIVSNRGGGIVHKFDDIDPHDSDPTITPNLPFWWSVPQGMAKVACAPCLFKTSGYICGVKSYFAQSIDATQRVPQGTPYYDANAGGCVASLREPDDVATAFTSGNIGRVRVDLTGNGVRTPNLYGALVAFKTVTALTAATDKDITPYTTRASLDVPDNANSVKWTIDLNRPQELEDSGVTGIAAMSNRPMSFRLGSITITNAVTEPPKYVLGIDDRATKLTIEARDKSKLLEHYLFSEPTPLDGLNLVDAFKLVLTTAGIPENLLDLEATAFSLPKSDAPSSQDGFAVLIKPGDTAMSWVERLHQNYCANWFMGWYPSSSGWKFRLASPDGLGSDSVLTIYDSVDDALDNEAELDNLPQYVYRSYSQHPLEPEANDVWVIGRDLRTGKPLIGHKADTASQDPTTAVSGRPNNWLGEVRKYGLYDATICSQAAVERAASVLFDRLTPQRLVAEFETGFLLKEDGSPVWRGDVITLNGYGKYRIKTISAEFKQEPDNSPVSTFWRPTKYVAEYIFNDSQGLTQLHGTSLTEVVGAHKLNSISKSLIRPDEQSSGLVTQKPLEVYLL